MDLNTTAFSVVKRATEESDDSESERRRGSTRHAGHLGGKARAKVLSAERRKEIAVKANQARWISRVETTIDS